MKKQFKSRADAFEQLGGSDDEKIECDEFVKFVEGKLGYSGDVSAKYIFEIIDASGDGSITKGEAPQMR